MMGRSEWWWTLSVDRRTITWLISLSPGLMVATRVVYHGADRWSEEGCSAAR